jgi:hypothetical protein
MLRILSSARDRRIWPAPASSSDSPRGNREAEGHNLLAGPEKEVHLGARRRPEHQVGLEGLGVPVSTWRTGIPLRQRKEDPEDQQKDVHEGSPEGFSAPAPADDVVHRVHRPVVPPDLVVEVRGGGQAPVIPTCAMTSPRSTSCPTRTRIREAWA